MEVKKIILAGALCLGSTAAMAGDTGFYFDLSLGQAAISGLDKGDIDAALTDQGAAISSSKFDDTGSFWSATVGYKPIRYVAGEISYIDLGNAKYRAYFDYSGTAYWYKLDVSSGGIAAAAVGILPIGRWFEVRGRGGVLFAKTSVDEYQEISSANASFSDNGSSSNLFYGVEAAFNATRNFSIHLGYHRFNNVGDSDVTGKYDFDALNFGITFSQ